MANKPWSYIPRKWGSSKIMGEAAQDAAIQEMARGHEERNQAAANTLFEWLIIDGVKERITVEDIENLASTGKSPEFMRNIVIELMVCLRKK